MKKSGRSCHTDQILLVLVMALAVSGLFFLYSSSSYNGRVRFHDPGYYLKKQLFATVLGMAAMFLVSRMDYHVWVSWAPAAYLISLGLSAAVLLVGQEINGSKRWLNLGFFSFQPSEAAKVAMILFLAWQIEKNAKKNSGFWFMCRTLFSLIPIVALVGANNLSTAIIILGIGAIVIFISDPRYLEFVLPVSVGIGFIGIFLAAESYRLERLRIWQNPEQYEKGFQTVQGLYAIGSGGLFGLGFGKSIQKLGFVPEAQNDMIFSIVCEELGLTGAILVILLFGLLTWRLAVIAVRSKDLTGALLAAGIMGHMILQVTLNVAVVTNSIPNTGITLPFISYGGTSVMFLLIEMGIALSVSGNRSSKWAYNIR